MRPRRLQAWLTGLWLGVVVCLGAVVAPAAFATLAPSEAGRLMGQLLREEAYISLFAALLLLLVERRRTRDEESGSALGLPMLLLLGTLFCTVAGYFAVQPMMAQARLGQGPWSFAALHAVSGSFFALKALLLATLAWRFTAPA